MQNREPWQEDKLLRAKNTRKTIKPKKRTVSRFLKPKDQMIEYNGM